jgi:hypothetical protein
MEITGSLFPSFFSFFPRCGSCIFLENIVNFRFDFLPALS